jgi:hypothetical protein
MSETVRVYVNSQPVDVPATAKAIDAIAAFGPEHANAIRTGEKAITDSRGIATTPDAPVHNGAIFRIVRARQTGDDNELNTQ